MENTNTKEVQVNDEQRERDIQSLCQAVLSIEPHCWDNPNGPYETRCPFCTAEENRGGQNPSGCYASMKELKHEPDCVYLVAKDLSTRNF